MIEDLINTFTPEETKTPVTYGDLATIMEVLVKLTAENTTKYADSLQDGTFEIINKLTDTLVEIRNDAEYKRQRDIRFVLALIAQIGNYDRGMLDKEYKRWCEEWDKLNKPQIITGVGNE